MFLFSLLALIASRQHRVLALLSEKDEKNAYSTFFSDLSSIGCNITYHLCGPKAIPLERFGEHTYDTLVILCSKSSCVNDELADFLDSGGNAIVFNSQLGGDIQDKIYRHLNLRVVNTHKISDVYSNNLVTLRKIVAPHEVVPESAEKIGPLLFEGGYSTIDRPNDFRFPIVVGGNEHKISTADKFVVSAASASNMIPISGFQGRTSGRIIVINSNNFASNEIYETKSAVGADLTVSETPIYPNGNRKLMNHLAKWVTHFNGHVKVDAATHYDAETKVTPVQYHINQDITVVANLSYVKDGEWGPYSGKDVQVEVFMLGTFVRRHMKLVKPGQYTETLKLPDRSGNFWIKVFTNKEGWVNAREEMAIAVRPLAIREKEKFLKCAEPYQLSMMLVMAATFLASVHFLYHKPSEYKPTGDTPQ